MKKALILITLCALPLAASAQTFTASLSGDMGTGFANFQINQTAIDYSIVTSGLDQPVSAMLTDGSNSIDLDPAFVGGSAFGSVDSAMAADIMAAPGMWTVEVGNGTDVLRGALAGSGEMAGTELVFPVAANVAGQAGTNFLTDARVINKGSSDANVTMYYYEEGANGHSEATAMAEMTLAAGEQVVINDIVNSTFAMAGTKGAVVAMSDGHIQGSMRIYNDQTGAGLGTFGQYVNGMDMDAAMDSGTLLFLSNEDSATAAGYRTNIGWFNPNAGTASVTFTAYDADGTMLGEKTLSVAGMAQEQYSVSSSKLWPSLEPYGDFYITYTVDGGNGLFVYASVVDNVNGDAIFVAAK